MQQKVVRSSGTLDLVTLPPAVYLIRVLDAVSGQATTRRVVKR